MHPRTIIREVLRLHAQLQGSLRLNTDTESHLAIIATELLGARQVVLVDKLLRVRLESDKGPHMRDAIHIAGKELPGGVAIRPLQKGGARSVGPCPRSGSCV